MQIYLPDKLLFVALVTNLQKFGRYVSDLRVLIFGKIGNNFTIFCSLPMFVSFLKSALNTADGHNMENLILCSVQKSSINLDCKYFVYL